jgi:hypothetical protein
MRCCPGPGNGSGPLHAPRPLRHAVSREGTMPRRHKAVGGIFPLRGRAESGRACASAGDGGEAADASCHRHPGLTSLSLSLVRRKRSDLMKSRRVRGPFAGRTVADALSGLPSVGASCKEPAGPHSQCSSVTRALTFPDVFAPAVGLGGLRPRDRFRRQRTLARGATRPGPCSTYVPRCQASFAPRAIMACQGACGRGGTGRRRRLKISCPTGRAGSSPAVRTSKDRKELGSPDDRRHHLKADPRPCCRCRDQLS